MSGRRYRQPSRTPPRSAGAGPADALPDFDLASPLGFEPALLKPETELGAFVLALAAAFNDLKGGVYVSRLVENTLKGNLSLAQRGQLGGMQGQSVRLIAGVLHELMVLIKKHQAVVSSPSFARLVNRLSKAQQDAWSRVRHVALGDDRVANATDADSQILVKLRNNLAYHYGARTLGKAYQAFFADALEALHDRAIVSDGTSMEATRFYFADAAMSEALAAATGIDREMVLERLAKLANTVSLAVKHIVVAYITGVAKLEPYAVSNV